MTKPNESDSTALKTDSATGTPAGLTVVGIGASAGGLAALRTFFSLIPQESGLAFVVVMHLSPEHESHLADLLQNTVHMPVIQVTETMPLKPNQVYVIPPAANLSTIDSHLRLSPLEKIRSARAPIDHFFRTLAKSHDGKAIGVILTGTGSDGTLGLREIKAQGGLAIVQDPNDAEFDGMPQSAISNGAAVIILPLARIPETILNFVQTRPHLAAVAGADPEVDERQLLQRIFALLRIRTGRDFSRYKPATILRRIIRRMQFHRIEDLSHYLETLTERPEEGHALADDLLINVTSFFRDHDVYQLLESRIIPQIFAGKQAQENLRIWSVGCATGEEAYSLTMLLLEAAARQSQAPRIQVFASELHGTSLEKAREGFYPGDIETDVSPERLARFFHKENGGYRIRREVRELVVFAPHNILSDPPFSHVDLISCRNLLIYLQREVQQEVLEVFHYALKPDGYLLLGSSETADAAELFRAEDKKRCLYRKLNLPRPELRLPVFPLTRANFSAEAPRSESLGEPFSYGALHQRLVEQVAPPSILVDADDKIVHLSSHVGRYLTHPGGEMTTNLYKLVQEELRVELRTALHQCRESGQPVRTPAIRVTLAGETRFVSLHIRLSQEIQQEGFALVIFEEWVQPETTQALTPANVRGPAVDEGEDELLRQRMQSIIEEYETSQEELKSSIEEMQSTNEELRSTMEELETSKEELQSMNEELQTVNQENRHKVEELAQLSGDLQNLLSATEIATLFLDRQLCILRFTPKVSELFNVRMTDRGRPLADFTNRLGYDQLDADAKQVLAQLQSIEREVQDERGFWYLTRLRPYRSTDDRIEGLVITFIDITTRKRAELALSEREQWLSALSRAFQAAIDDAPLEKSLDILLAAALSQFDVPPRGAFYIADARDRCLHPINVPSGMPLSYAQRVDNSAIGSDSLACGIANFSNKPVITPDVNEEPLWQPWLSLAQEFGFRGCWSFPINTAAGHTIGTFALYHAQPREATPKEIENAMVVTQAAAIIISRHLEAERGKQLEVQRTVAESAVRTSEARQMFLLKLSDALRPLVDAADIQLRAMQILGEHLGVLRAQYWEPDSTDEYVDSAGGYTNGSVQPLTQRVRMDDFGSFVKPAFQAGLTTAVADAANDPRITKAELSTYDAWGFHAWVAVPLVKHNRLVAVLGLHHALAHQWTAEEITLVEDVAQRTWAAVERAKAETARNESQKELHELNSELDERVRSQTRELLVRENQLQGLTLELTHAEQKERRRIALLLHDDVQQLIVAAKMRAGAMQSSQMTTEQKSQLKLISELMEQTLSVTRSMITDLVPLNLHEQGLGAALAELAAKMRQQHNLLVRVNVAENAEPESIDLLELLFDATRELLLNVVKHAQTDCAWVDLQREGSEILLTVRDHGKGRPTTNSGRVGFGLFHLRERLKSIQGQLDVQSEPSIGMTVTIRVNTAH